MKVVAAMSGGVDSSVAAALLKEEGHNVIGITMQLWPRADEKDDNNGSAGCCGLDTIEDARRVAFRLGIPHYVVDLRDTFRQYIINNFCEEYSLGRTPNPCIRCNKYIKFGALMDKAVELGTDYIATGHHARVERDKTTGEYLLKKGSDARKDQSYFLYQLNQAQLSHSIFPIGNITKDRVRQIARKMELLVADKPGSQEICFIVGADYGQFLRNNMPEAPEPGPILDQQGNVLGKHQGLILYTVGQRKGLGIAAAEPLYVTAIEPERNTVVVGTKEQTYGRELIATDLNWIMHPTPKESITVKARIRYRHPEAEATTTPLNNNDVYVKFAEPQMAITPGQAIVFYNGDVVIGGGIIKKIGRE